MSRRKANITITRRRDPPEGRPSPSQRVRELLTWNNLAMVIFATMVAVYPVAYVLSWNAAGRHAEEVAHSERVLGEDGVFVAMRQVDPRFHCPPEDSYAEFEVTVRDPDGRRTVTLCCTVTPLRGLEPSCRAMNGIE